MRERAQLRRDAEGFRDRAGREARVPVVGHQTFALDRMPPQERVGQRAQGCGQRRRRRAGDTEYAEKRCDRDGMVEPLVLREPRGEQAAQREAGDDDRRAEPARDREAFVRRVDELLRAHVAKLRGEAVARAVTGQPRDDDRVAVRVQPPRERVALHRARGEAVQKQDRARGGAAVRQQHRAAARVDRVVVTLGERGVRAERAVVIKRHARPA